MKYVEDEVSNDVSIAVKYVYKLEEMMKNHSKKLLILLLQEYMNLI